jgi:periplasmic nitrate reductase NapE
LGFVVDAAPEGHALMDARVGDTRAQPATKSRRLRELFVFLLLAVLIWPFIAVGVVAGWGFVVWMYYLFTGPPGPV